MPQSPLGWFNPALYGKNLGANITNDIVSGRNNCCEYDVDVECCPVGFSASKGWDPITGASSSSSSS